MARQPPPPDPRPGSAPDQTVLNAVEQAARWTGLTERQIFHDHQLVRIASVLCRPFTDYEEALLVLKGGTALAKQGVTARHSEDIDLGIVPPMGETFGSSRRDRCMREIGGRAESLGDRPTARRRGKGYSSFLIPYPPLDELDDAEPPSVKVEVTVGAGIGRGETVALESLASEFLDSDDAAPAEALCCHPLETLGEKLHALTRITAHDPPERIATRVRDIYDIACIFQWCGDDLAPGDLNELYQAANRPPDSRERASYETPIPPGGLRSLDLWRPGSERHALLARAYDHAIEPIIYGEPMSFQDCIRVIQAHAHLM